MEKVDHCDCPYFAKKLVAAAELNEGGESVSGPVHSVISSIDRRTFRNMTFELESHTPRLKLTFGSGFYSLDGRGIHLEVSSSRQGWVRQTFTELSDEIDKGVPRWHFLRTFPGLALIAATGALAGFAIAVPIWQAADGTAKVLASLPVSLLMTFSPILAFTWAFPGFEITHEGGTTTGARRLAFIGGLLLSVPIGIVINLLTS